MEALRTSQPNAATPASPGGDRRAEAKPASLDMATDHFKYGMMSTAAVQDSTRTASILSRNTAMHSKVLEHVTLFTNGEREAVVPFFRWAGSIAGRAALSVGPKFGKVASGLNVALRGTGAAFTVLTKYCQIITLPFAAMDVVDAVREHEPKAKRAAVTNASISVVSAITGVIGIFWWSTPLGLPSLVISIACGGFQLADQLALHGKANSWLAEHTLGKLQK
ncbi:MAG: hypothetical protein JWM80_5849 [Cyanobacteria bacterium RYN_339]|nr:hypothetical protein [Cyanobacteria bacterium RYN_339]